MPLIHHPPAGWPYTFATLAPSIQPHLCHAINNLKLLRIQSNNLCIYFILFPLLIPALGYVGVPVMYSTVLYLHTGIQKTGVFLLRLHRVVSLSTRWRQMLGEIWTEKALAYKINSERSKFQFHFIKRANNLNSIDNKMKINSFSIRIAMDEGIESTIKTNF